MLNYFFVIKIKRFILRKFEIEDVSNILKYLFDKEVMKYYGLEFFKMVEDVLNEIVWYKLILNEKSGIRWGIIFKE